MGFPVSTSGAGFSIIDASKAPFNVVASQAGQPTVDQSVNIQAALSAAAALGTTFGAAQGALVLLPPGNMRVNHTLTVKYQTWLTGYGNLTRLVPGAAWAGGNNPVIHLDSTQTGARVSDLAIYADGAIPNTVPGITIDTGVAFASALGGVYTTVENVLVQVNNGDGIQLGSLECRLRNVYVSAGAGNGFNITGTDNFLESCTADTCGQNGFFVNAGNVKLTGCKAFGGGAQGFYNVGPRNMYSACEAQDNASCGFFDLGGDSAFAGCVADTNGQAGVSGNDKQTGFFLKGASSASGCVAINRSGTPQKWGYFGQTLNSTRPQVWGTSRLAGTADVDPTSNIYAVVNGTIYNLP